MMGGQVGIADHLNIGDHVMINAKSGVTSSIPPGSRISGNPHTDILTWRKARATVPRLYDLLKEFKRLKKRVEDLEARSQKE